MGKFFVTFIPAKSNIGFICLSFKSLSDEPLFSPVKILRMKRFTLLLSAMLCSFLLLAQENSSSGITVIQTVTDENGQQTVRKKKLEPGQNLQEYIQQLKAGNAHEMEIEIIAPDGVQGGMGAKEENTMLFFREGKSGDAKSCDKKSHLKELRIYHGGAEAPHMQHQKMMMHENLVSRPFLGVYLEDVVGENGVKITGTVSGAGAEKAGLKEGDILTDLNGHAVGSNGELRTVLGKFKPGEQITAGFLRDGQPQQVKVTLGEKNLPQWNGYSYSYERDPCKPFIGIYSSNVGQGGMTISGVIDNTPATEYGLQKGDVVTALDGIVTKTHGELVALRDKHKAGDYFTLSIIREGTPMDVKLRFKPCEKNEPPVQEPAIVETPVVTDNPNQAIEIQTLQLEEYNAYPNPTYGELNVEFKAEAVPTQVRIFDVTGKVVFEDVLNNFDGYYSKRVDLGNATPGAMTLNILQNDKMVSKNIILLNRA